MEKEVLKFKKLEMLQFISLKEITSDLIFKTPMANLLKSQLWGEMFISKKSTFLELHGPINSVSRLWTLRWREKILPSETSTVWILPWWKKGTVWLKMWRRIRYMQLVTMERSKSSMSELVQELNQHTIFQRQGKISIGEVSLRSMDVLSYIQHPVSDYLNAPLFIITELMNKFIIKRPTTFYIKSHYLLRNVLSTFSV